MGFNSGFKGLKMANQDLLLNFVGQQYVNVFFLPHFLNFSYRCKLLFYPKLLFFFKLRKCVLSYPFRERYFYSYQALFIQFP